ncbi:response regulator [Pontibacter beigongshangensis]|uniref:response regulator n=1 Tax=Pontibacter beigongshangensis TaxID=2574733 RepID=UPI00164FF3DC|nr:hypothetical protein [Pontibacter beigongshangensis]
MPRLKHILLINNDPIHNLFSQIVLEDANASELITVCQSMPEAIEFLNNISSGTGIPFPDLILLDINLPDNGCIYFLDTYHALNYHITEPTAISIFTASIGFELTELAHQYSAVASYIPKPLSLTSLYKVLTPTFSYSLSKQF